jgi:hypothetical protein
MLASGRVPPVIFRFRCAAQVQACGLIMPGSVIDNEKKGQENTVYLLQ